VVITTDHTNAAVEIHRILTSTKQTLKFWDSGLGYWVLELAHNPNVMRVPLYGILFVGFYLDNEFFFDYAVGLVAVFELVCLLGRKQTWACVTRPVVDQLRSSYIQLIQMLLLGSSIRCWDRNIATCHYKVAEEEELVKKDPQGVFYRFVLSLAGHLSRNQPSSRANLLTLFEMQLELARKTPVSRVVHLSSEIMELIHFLTTDPCAIEVLTQLRRSQQLPPGNMPIFSQRQLH
jgi:hypothetical protein